MDIYADILFLQNLALDYTILSLAAKLSSSGTSALRLIFGSAAGALSSVAYIIIASVTSVSAFIMVIFLAVTLVLITVIGYGYKNPSMFLRQLLSIMIISLAVGGLLLVWQTGFKSGIKPIDGKFLMPNTVFWDICWVCIIAYALLRVFSEEVVERLIYRETYKKVKIVYDGKTKVLDGFVDTGNMLCDPFSGAPVALADAKSMSDIVPVLCSGKIDNVSSLGEDDRLRNRLCLIPYKTAGNEEGIFPGFRPDRFEVEGRGIIPGAVIGISRSKLSDDDSFSIIISAAMI